MTSASAVDIGDASDIEYSNLTNDDAIALSQEKLEVSNEDSISETNIVNSHDDNLNDYPGDSVLTSCDESYYEDNGEQKLGLAISDINNTVSVSSEDTVVLSKSAKNVLTASEKVKTSLSISNTHYDKSATYFKVTLQDANGKAISNQKITLKVNKKTYSANTNSKGIANIKTAALAKGTYTVSLAYAGTTSYASSSLSKKVKVLSSVSGSDLTKYYGSSSYFTAKFWKDNSVLGNAKVTFYVGSSKHTVTTDKNGVAVLKNEFKPGQYSVKVTNPISGEKLTKKMVVKKDKTSLKGNSKTYILPNNYYTYTVKLTSAHGGPLKNYKVQFSYAGKNVTAKTDSKGKASTVIPLLEKGTYKISYKTNATSGYYSAHSSGTIYIQAAQNKLTASDLKMVYNDGSKFTVKFTDKSGKAVSGEPIKFYLNDKYYKIKTDSKGVASLAVGDLKPGTYKIKYFHSDLGSSDYNYGYKNVVITKVSAKLTAYNLVMKPNDGSSYKATVKDASGKALKDVTVKFKLNGKTYAQKTDSKGVAKLKITLSTGYYPITSEISDSCYSANTVSKHVLVNGSKFVASDKYVASGNKVSFSVKLVDGKSSPIKNKNIKFTFNGKSYTKKTNSKGAATVSLGKLAVGKYNIKYAYGNNTDSSKIQVINKISLNDIIKASKNVKSFIQKNKKLPSSVKIGGIAFSTADYLYLASKAIVNLNASKKSSIAFKNIKDPSKPGAASNMGNLKNYLAVAKSVIKTADSKGKMPNSVSSSVGDIGYKGLVYAFARVVAFYGDEKIMPNYVTIKSLTSSSGTTSKLNSKNTISNLAAYLAASTNCQVNNTKIKQLVEKLTKGLTSDKAKATAIYNYVRDTISYSFYYDTKYGAVGTLNAKTGNCVDHSHLLVAMYRTAGLAARYVHGTCTFSSGTYGHVWTQVLIGDTWTVSDATSPRNSFGNVVNWNSNSYTLKGYYASIGF